jgi:predicted nucleic acid-binding protein
MLVDTSVLVRTLQPHHPLYIAADRAIQLLPEQGRELHIVAQNLIELWTVATRPLGENGLGMTSAEAASQLERIKGMFLFLPETPAIYPAWESLVIRHRVTGKPAHDARLVAAMLAHGLTQFSLSTEPAFPVIPVSRSFIRSRSRPSRIRVVKIKPRSTILDPSLSCSQTEPNA